MVGQLSLLVHEERHNSNPHRIISFIFQMTNLYVLFVGLCLITLKIFSGLTYGVYYSFEDSCYIFLEICLNCFTLIILLILKI